MKKLIYILSISLIFSYSEGGYPGAGFRYGSNAREISMAGAMNSVYNQGYNSFGNPGLLSEVKNIEYGFSYFSMSLDRSIQSFSISRPMPPTASVAFSFMRAGVDDISLTDWSGNIISDIGSWEGFGMLSFGNKFGNLSIGINLKAYKNQLTSNYSSDGAGVDIGLIYKLSKYERVGIYIKNLSSTYNWKIDYDNSSNQYEEKMPRLISLGYSKQKQKFLISGQLDFLSTEYNQYIKLRVGTELNMLKISDIHLYLRFGLIFDVVNPIYTIGCGVPFKINESMDMEFNYALDLGIEGEGISHLITFSILNY